jgi:hypothetical protein
MKQMKKRQQRNLEKDSNISGAKDPDYVKRKKKVCVLIGVNHWTILN